LEKAYSGVEQQNADVRRLVRRKANWEYVKIIEHALKSGTPTPAKIDHVRMHASEIVEAVIDRLIEAYKASNDVKVYEESAHLAVSLIVADAIVACEVLERP
jgi:hypothetical protein